MLMLEDEQCFHDRKQQRVSRTCWVGLMKVYSIKDLLHNDPNEADAMEMRRFRAKRHKSRTKEALSVPVCIVLFFKVI